MKKKILITGATDGIGKVTAQHLLEQGHQVLIHGRNQDKLDKTYQQLKAGCAKGVISPLRADLSRMSDVLTMAHNVRTEHSSLDVLINNAGIFRTPQRLTEDGLDVRFAVNTLAPYLLTKQLLPLLGSDARVINLSSAAQSCIDLIALEGRAKLSDNEAYAQSKLALTIWSQNLGQTYQQSGPTIVAVNPGSLLGSKMVKEAYGIAGGDIEIGADILIRAALSAEFANAGGQYFDNDSGRFSDPHSDALNPEKVAQVMSAIDKLVREITQKT